MTDSTLQRTICCADEAQLSRAKGYVDANENFGLDAKSESDLSLFAGLSVREFWSCRTRTLSRNIWISPNLFCDIKTGTEVLIQIPNFFQFRTINCRVYLLIGAVLV
jgi:hypothetical protein